MIKKTSQALIFGFLYTLARCQDGFGTSAVDLSTAINKFSETLYGEIALTQKESFALSPVSIYLCLSMLYEGSSGAQREELKKLLSLPDDEQTRLYNMKELVKGLNVVVEKESYDDNDQDDFQPKMLEMLKTRVANSFWVSKDVSPQPTFVNTLKNYYDGSVHRVDFRKSESAVAKINKWISTNTFKMIKQALSSIPESTLLALVNTVYFKARWRSDFSKDSTHKDIFHSKDGSKKKMDFMNDKMYLNFATHGKAELVELPYKESPYSMIIKYGSEGLNHLTKPELLAVLNKEQKEEVRLTMPKFDYTTDIDLGKVLKNLGVQEIFKMTRTGFSKIIPNTELGVTSILHKSRIKVDEKGTEAAAVTIILMGATAIPAEPKIIKLDRPFSFYIVDKDQGSILFSGAFQG